MAAEVELILDCQSMLGEGPVWHEGAFYWVDIEGETLNRMAPDGGDAKSWNVGQKIGCAVPAADGRWVGGMHHGLAWIDLAAGETEPICDPEADRPNSRFNDGKCDPAGRLWAGTMSMKGEGPVGALYRIESDGACARMVEGITTSNGLAWSSDRKTFYYIDTPTQRVDAFDYDVDTGDLSNRRTVISIEGGGRPDGMCIDAEDHLWVALWEGFGLLRINPATGEVVDRLSVPVARVTSCCFGGADYRDLYITTARVGLSEKERRTEQPHAGSVFRVRLPVGGPPCVVFGT